MIIAGTGHRPDKLGGYSDGATQRLVRVARKSIEHLSATRVITGMALGWDQALAIACLELGIPFVAAIPFEGQEGKWPARSQALFRQLREKADEVVVVSSGGYSVEKMQIRNVWMVDHCDRVLALWNGTSGGTRNCLDYARSVKKPVSNAWKAFAAEPW